MRIYTGQTTGFFQTAAINRSVNKNRPEKGQQAGTPARMDMAFLSPQGRSSSLLANLMNQKEMIQSSKEYLLTKALDDQNGAGAAGLQEQLEDYEKQLDSINEQIAAEMAKQAENKGEQGSAGQEGQAGGALAGENACASAEEEAAKLTKLSAELEKTQAVQKAQVRREGEKRVCEAQMESGLGSAAAEQRLDKISQMETLTGQWAQAWKKMGR